MASSPPRHPRRRSRRLVAGAAIVALAGLWIVLWQLRGPGGARVERLSEELPDAPPVTVERNPASYRVVYRVEDRLGEETEVRTVEMAVRRPFEARIETRMGPPPGERQAGQQAWAFGRIAIGAGEDDPPVLAWPPSLIDRDLRVEWLLEDAVDGGDVEARERRRVGDRACQVYRFGDRISDGSFEPYENGGAEYADACIDEAGLVLEEVLWEGGGVPHYQVAVDVEEEPELSDDLFPVGAEPGLAGDEGGGSVRALTPDSQLPDTFWVLEDAPEGPEALQGLEYRGRYAVVPPSPGGMQDPAAQAGMRISVTDVWARGADMLVFDQGVTFDGNDAFQPQPHGERLELGDLGEAELLVRGAGTEVRVNHDEGRFVRLVGTLDPRRLLEVARSLGPVEGSGEILPLAELEDETE